MIGLKVAFAEKGNGFAAVQAKIPQAIADGLNEGGRLVFTKVRQGLREQVNPKAYKTITLRTYPMSANPGSLVYTIVVKGKPTPIKEFQVRRTGGGVWSSPWGVGRVFARSFQEKSASGAYKPGVWRARVTSEHLPIRPLFGPNLAKEMLGITRNNQRMPTIFHLAVLGSVEPMLSKRLSRAFGG